MAIMAQCELGKKTKYSANYDPKLLFAIPRSDKRHEIAITTKLPFKGIDIWNHYEVSWLNPRGKPIAGIAQIIYSCRSPNIIESKSMKLYFNSLNNSIFTDLATLCSVLKADLSAKVGSAVEVCLNDLSDATDEQLHASMHGVCLDKLDISCSDYTINSQNLYIEDELTTESLYSNLLKSNCLITHQPDWASIEIKYQGNKINHEGLLRYLISFRNHNEFHEQCIERIFVDIMHQCKPRELSVYGRYTRRGGLDINVYRGTTDIDPSLINLRLIRQ